MSLWFLIAAAVVAMGAQCSLSGMFNIGGARLDLMPGVVLYAALTGSWQQTMGTAVAAALLLDTPSFARLGLSLPPFLAVGLAINHFQKVLYRDHALVRFGLAAAISLAASLWTWLALRLTATPLPMTAGVAGKILLISLLAASAALPLFWMLDVARRWRRYDPVETETF
jgi:membrane-anchored protein YejM (alkaline phosphatase superfamily)